MHGTVDGDAQGPDRDTRQAAFAAATAQQLKVPVVTRDPVFRCLEGAVTVVWTAEPGSTQR